MARRFCKGIATHRYITLEQLEERIVLDAACDSSDQSDSDQDQVDTSQEAAGDQASPPEATGAPEAQAEQASDPLSEIFNQDLSVVLISNGLDQVEALETAVVDDAIVVVYDSESCDLSGLVNELQTLVDSTGSQIGHLAILCHGVPGALELSDTEQITALDVLSNSEPWQALGSLLTDDARLDLYACDLSSGDNGLAFVTIVSEVTGATVWASDDTTGGIDGDWDLEVQTGDSDQGYLIDGSALDDLGVSLAVSDPVVYDQIISPNPDEDTPFTITVTGHDGKEPDLDDVVFTIVTDPAHGTLTAGEKHDLGNGDYSQDFTYTPDENYNGDDSFQFTMTTPAAGPWKEFLSTPGKFDTDYSQTVALGDLDNDGDLDAVVGGGQLYYYSKVYFNDGTGNFANPIDLEVGQALSIVLGDMNNDGYLDIVAGFWEDVNKVYFNDGTGHFSAGSIIGSDEDNTRAIAVADVDNDGDLDVIVGNDGGTNTVYFNDNGTGTFSTWTSLGSSGDSTYSLAVGDVDNDGDLDLVTGSWYSGQTRVYENDGAGVFSLLYTLPSSVWYVMSVEMGDADNDGDLDLFLGTYQQANRVCFNDGTGHFSTTVTIGTHTDRTNSIAVGDVDNDGDLDVIAGNDKSTENRVYLNDGTGHYSYAGDVSDYKRSTNEIQLGDVDNDGDLDIVDVDNNWAWVFFNNGRDYASLAFEASSISNQIDLTYSIAAGDIDNDGDVDFIVGNRNTGTDGQSGVYTNDGDGVFSVVGTLGDHTDATEAVQLADLDNDGDLDAIAGNWMETNKVYYNDGSGGFSSDSEAWITLSQDDGIDDEADKTRDIAVGDLNGDGYLDVVVVNDGYNRVYLNNGASDVASRGFLSPSDWGHKGDDTYSVQLADFDNDGDLDAAIGNNGEVNWVYFNDGTGDFVYVVPLGSEKNNTHSIAVGDVDNDGDMDIVAGNYNQKNYLFLNNGDGTFAAAVEIDSYEGPTEEVQLVDVNHDGNLDLVEGNDGAPSKIYINDGNGNFSAPTDVTTTSYNTKAIAAADVDLDGDIDLIAGNRMQLNTLFTMADTAESDPGTISFTIASIADNPTGANDTVTTTEEVDYTFEVGDFTFNDGDSDAFAGIKIVSVETEGDLEYDGTDVVAGQDATDVTKLVFKPAEDGFGDPYATFTFKVVDSSGAYSDDTYTMTVNVTNVPDNPTGGNDEVTTNEDVDYTFKTSDFTFNDVDGDTFNGIQVVTIETKGDLEYNSSDVTSTQYIDDVSQLVFKPDSDENASPYATFTFRVRDSSGAYSDVVYTMTINVTSVNDEPSYTGPTSASAYEDVPVEIGSFTGDDGDSDLDQTLTYWLVAGNLSNGDLYRTEADAQNRIDAIDLSGGDVEVTWGDSVWFMSDPDNDIDTSFKLYVTDDGGGANGGDDTSGDYTVDITVDPVNDEPYYTGPTDVSALEDVAKSITFSGDDGDPDSGDPFNEQTVSYWLVAGDLSDGDLYRTEADAQNRTNAIDLSSGDVEVTWGDTVWFMSDTNANTDTSFDLYVKDNGGTANGGDDTSPTYTVNITVTPVNDEPSYTGPTSVSTDEDVPVEIGTFTGDDGDPDVDQPLSYWIVAGNLSNGDLYRSEADAQNGVNAIDLSSGNVKVTWGDSVWFMSDPDDNTDTSFRLYVTDDGGTANGGDDTSEDYTIDINVNAVNDPPVIAVPGDQTLLEDTSLDITGISVSDVDVDEGTGQVQVSLSVSHGSVSLFQTDNLTFDAGSDGSANMIFTGLLADVNNALSTVTYEPAPNYFGMDTLDALVSDLGNFGGGGDREAKAAIEITVVDVPEFDEFGKSYGVPWNSGHGIGPETGPLSTVGSTPAIGDLLQSLSTMGLLPSDLTGNEGPHAGGSSPALAQLEMLMNQALFGETQQTQDQAWASLLSFVSGMGAEKDQEWLGLEDFLGKLRGWQAGKTLDEILLVFNMDEINLLEWFNSLMSPAHDWVGNQQAAALAPGEHLPQARSTKLVVFDMNQLRMADLLSEDLGGNDYTNSQGLASKSGGPVCSIFDINDISFMQCLAG